MDSFAEILTPSHACEDNKQLQCELCFHNLTLKHIYMISQDMQLYGASSARLHFPPSSQMVSRMPSNQNSMDSPACICSLPRLPLYFTGICLWFPSSLEFYSSFFLVYFSHRVPCFISFCMCMTFTWFLDLTFCLLFAWIPCYASCQPAYDFSLLIKHLSSEQAHTCLLCPALRRSPLLPTNSGITLVTNFQPNTLNQH